MKLVADNHQVLLFTHPHRTYDYQEYTQHHFEMIEWASKFEAEGMLCSTSSYDYFDPFLWAQFLCSRTEKLKPYIAVNPIYIHPYTAARMVASLTHLYQRKIWVNFITGSAKADMQQINDLINKEERYDRLYEFIEVFTALLKSQMPVNYEGKYYTVSKSSLRTPLIDELFPGITAAGESDGAIKISEELHIPLMTMLPSDMPTSQNITHKSLAFGIITRPTREEAIEASYALYPKDKFGQKLLKFSMADNDTLWKARIYDELTNNHAENSLYFLDPFKYKYADCPYILGSYDEIAELISKIAQLKPHSFVLTIRNEEEFTHINTVFEMVNTLCEK